MQSENCGTSEFPSNVRTVRAPHALPLLGHVVPLQRRPLDFLLEIGHHSDVVEVRIGLQRAYLVCRPDLVREVLVDSRRFDKGGWIFDNLRLLVGNGLVTATRDEHHRQRRHIQPAFHHSRIDQYVGVMTLEAVTATARWHAGVPLDMAEAMHTVTTRITMRTLFAADLDGAVATALQEALPIYLRGVYRRAMFPIRFPSTAPVPGNLRFARACRTLHGVIDSVIAAHRTPSEPVSLLDALTVSRDPDTGQTLTEGEIHEQVMAMLLAATETVASALTWTLYLLSTHPDEEKRLQAEADRILGDRPPTLSDLPHLAVARRVLNEALRIRPPAWLFTRVVTCPTNLAGIELKPKTTLLISPYLLHHRPDLFPQPERFVPDRWLSTSPLYRARAAQRGALLPFGAGNRKCIGDSYAITWALLVLVSIAARWRLRTVCDTPIRPVPKATLGTGRLLMIPEPRTPAA